MSNAEMRDRARHGIIIIFISMIGHNICARVVHGWLAFRDSTIGPIALYRTEEDRANVHLYMLCKSTSERAAATIPSRLHADVARDSSWLYVTILVSCTWCGATEVNSGCRQDNKVSDSLLYRKRRGGGGSIIRVYTVEYICLHATIIWCPRWVWMRMRTINTFTIRRNLVESNSESNSLVKWIELI